MNDAPLQTLIDAHLDGSLTPGQAAELSRALCESSDARRTYWKCAAIHGLLPQAAKIEWLGLARGEGAAPVSSREPRSVRAWWTSPHFLWTAAAVFMVLALGFWAPWNPRQAADNADPEAEEFADREAPPAPHRVATITRMAGVEWADGNPALAVNSMLEPGWLKLKTGLVQLEFFSGASVILEGPAEFELRSENEGFCRVGRLSAHVPEPARGFIVGSPSVALVDLGTAFGMDVRPGGDGEVYVFDGQVRLTGAGAQDISRAIDKGQGAHVDSAGRVSAVSKPRVAFVTQTDLAHRQQQEESARYEQWHRASDSLRHDPALLVYFNFENQSSLDRTLANQKPGAASITSGTLVGCEWAAGRWPQKHALEYKSLGDRVRLEVPGELQSLTLMAWVRADSLSHRYNALLVGESYHRGMLRWQLTRNGQIVLSQFLVDEEPRNKSEHAQSVVSPTVLTPSRLGQWLHLATVAELGSGKVTHYLDGEEVAFGQFPKRLPGLLGRVELGNWAMEGDTERAREFNVGTNLALHGYVGVSINYKLRKAQGQVTWPQSLHDAKTAVRWLRNHAERLHINPDHIGVIGFSAGGNLASMLAVTRPEDGLDPKGPYVEFSSRVQCAVNFYGAVDLMNYHDMKMFAKTREEAPELYRKASPVTYAHKAAAPLLIVHGTADDVVDVSQSKALAAALQKAGAPHELVIIPNAPHTFDLQPRQRDLRPLVLGFFNEHLKSAKPAAAATSTSPVTR